MRRATAADRAPRPVQRVPERPGGRSGTPWSGSSRSRAGPVQPRRIGAFGRRGSLDAGRPQQVKAARPGRSTSQALAGSRRDDPTSLTWLSASPRTLSIWDETSPARQRPLSVLDNVCCWAPSPFFSVPIPGRWRRPALMSTDLDRSTSRRSLATSTSQIDISQIDRSIDISSANLRRPLDADRSRSRAAGDVRP